MIPQLALQLYTVRDLLAGDFTTTMERIAEIGYSGVETAFFSDNITLPEAAQLIRDLSFSVPAAHCEIPLGNQEDMVLRQAETLGCKSIIWHGWPQDEDYSTIDGIKRLADRYNQSNEICQVNGYRFGIHNHWWEFELVEGQYPYQILAQEMDSRIIFELDTYWIKTAGLDPAAVIKELNIRAPLLHIKDGPALKNKPMVAAGQGTMDIPAIQAAADNNAEWLIVEMDECETDMLVAVEQSYHYLTHNGFAQGKR